jgi:NADH dehydrogenase
MRKPKCQIVIVGGGAGGLELARKLGARYGRKHHDIILVEKNRTHIWKPLLHEVAAGSLDANLDEVGYRSHCHRWGYRFFCGTFAGVDRDTREVIIAPLRDDDGSELIGEHRIRYDYLVIALGAVSNDFGTPGVDRYSLTLDDRASADRFRSKLLNHCLRVSRAMRANPAADAHVHVVVVGGGATGVELAAELYNSAAALRYYGLEVFDESRLTVTLVEAGPRILPALPDRLAEAAHAELEALGVRIVTSVRVIEAKAHSIITNTGEEIEADLQVWAAGVKGAVPPQSDGLELSPSNQLIVRPTLQTSLDDRIFAIGDCCWFVPEGHNRPVPPRAQAAHQMASTVLRNLSRIQSGKTLRPFVYRDHGSLVSLSRFSTIGSLMGNLIGGRMAIEGRLARFVYRSLYRMHVIAVHGWLKGAALLSIGRLNAIIRPRLKLH